MISGSYYERNRDTIRAKQREYYHANKDFFRKKGHEYYSKNRDAILAQSREHNGTDAAKKKKREYYEKNKGRLRVAHLAWASKNPERLWAYGTTSRHREDGRVVDITVNELVEIAKENTRCNYCGIELNFRGNPLGGRRDSASLDRISNGGTLTRDNVQVLCMRCNATKHDRTHDDFIGFCEMMVSKFGTGVKS